MEARCGRIRENILYIEEATRRYFLTCSLLPPQARPARIQIDIQIRNDQLLVCRIVRPVFNLVGIQRDGRRLLYTENGDGLEFLINRVSAIAPDLQIAISGTEVQNPVRSWRIAFTIVNVGIARCSTTRVQRHEE